jgi:hypothetical protein
MFPQASTGLMSADEAATFSAFDTSHQAAIGILLVGIALLIWAGRRFRLADPGDRLGKVLAVVTLALTVPLQILYFTPSYWDLQKTLPIQLCDLASFVAIYALWTHKRWAVGLVYYWGLTLTTQAIITPDLAAASSPCGPSRPGPGPADAVRVRHGSGKRRRSRQGEERAFGATQSRQNSLPSTSCITRHDSLWSSASNSRTRTAPSGTSRAHSASRAASRSSPTSPVPTRTSRCSRFLTTFPSGTRWKNSRGPTPVGSTHANAEP